ncbi:MAG: hypothetical protein J3Q66DRAFT_367965 [Benniella sp.]|nr:MAG: hypothetical protein J3Q66DRAFT_367965 [Benniella sp.]
MIALLHSPRLTVTQNKIFELHGQSSVARKWTETSVHAATAPYSAAGSQTTCTYSRLHVHPIRRRKYVLIHKVFTRAYSSALALGVTLPSPSALNQNIRPTASENYFMNRNVGDKMFEPRGQSILAQTDKDR